MESQGRRHPAVAATVGGAPVSVAEVVPSAVALAPAPSLRLGLGVAILILALVKARVILGRYLDLDDYPGARRVFTGILVAWGAAALGLYLAAG